MKTLRYILASTICALCLSSCADYPFTVFGEYSPDGKTWYKGGFTNPGRPTGKQPVRSLK